MWGNYGVVNLMNTKLFTQLATPWSPFENILSSNQFTLAHAPMLYAPPNFSTHSMMINTFYYMLFA